jgi:hypothetical protein
MKKIKLLLTENQMQALILMINVAGISIVNGDIKMMALKEQYTKLFIKLQTRILNLKPKNNSLKLTITECWAIDTIRAFNLFGGFELNTLKTICRNIEQQIINM